ncbi:MAG: G8 domain-containing protein [Phycisphaerales bacterium]
MFDRRTPRGGICRFLGRLRNWTPGPSPAALAATWATAVATAPAWADGPWSDPASWPDGTVPVAGELVVIPADTDIVLDVSPPPLAGVDVLGRLAFADDADLELTSEWIRVFGPGSELRIGATDAPHEHRATITLTGTDESANVFGEGLMASGTKFLMAAVGGSIELHGISRDKTSWSQLDGHLAPGDTTMMLARPVNWSAGDEVVIAPSGHDPDEAEVVFVLNVSDDGRMVTFGPQLAFAHYGAIETHAGRELDMRAEVGLLSRNIVVRGDAASETSRFGGHTMIMPGGQARVEGTLFYRMGQMGHKARYPFHMHVVDRIGVLGVTGADTWVRDNTVRRSYQRAFVLHGTNGVEVADNVAYRIHNHAYVPAEDGDESGNRFVDNLAITIIEPDEFAFPDEDHDDRSIQSEHRTSGFWLRNPNNTLIGNHVAGTWRGAGFMYDGAREDDGFERMSPTAAIFRDNLSHTNRSTNNEPHPYQQHVFGLGFFAHRISRWQHDGLLMVEDFTTYKNEGPGIWLENENELVSGAMVADSHAGFAARHGTIQDAVVVGSSGNSIGSLDRLRHGVAWRNDNGRDFSMDGVTFKDVDIVVHGNHGFDYRQGATMRDVSYEGSVGLLMVIENEEAEGSILDVDGTFSGTGTPTVVSTQSMGPQSTPLLGAASTWATPVGATGLWQLVIDDPVTGANAGASVTVHHHGHHHHPVPGGQGIRVRVNDDQHTVYHGGPINVSGLVGGWNRIELTLLDGDGNSGGGSAIRDRVNLYVPEFAACPGDVNEDGVVDTGDLVLVLARWDEETAGAYEGGDADGDAVVTIADLLTVLGSFGVTCAG